jgi:D-alanyl-D-alanine carboxypeptidase/D-alanyl-D-alanine-endopeptidase (penicillin-binding protein 4)
MRTCVLALLLICLCSPARAGGAEKKIKEIAGSPGIKNASWGLSVKDAATGKVVAEHDPRRVLVPASILKVFVTAAALDRFGPEKTFTTELIYYGKVSNGFLNGNLYIIGGGDPSLGSQLVKGAPPLAEVYKGWTAAVKAAGIKVINGAVVGDDTFFDSVQPGSWAWEDIGNYYAALPSALTVNDGLYKLYLKPSDRVGGEAAVLRTEPYIEGLKFEDYLKTGPAGSGDLSYIYAFPGQYTAVLRGSIPQGQPEFVVKGALPDPALFEAQDFAAYLTRAGINANKKPFRGAPPTGEEGTSVTQTASRPLKDVVRVTNKRSFNLYAEMLLRHLGAGRPDAGLAAVRSYLSSMGADVSELSMEDACGLSPADKVKAENFTDLLRAVYRKNYYADLYDSLVFPCDPDATGHVRNLGKGTPLEKNLRLKSGSLNGVRSYTGYLKTKKGRTLAFTSIMNNYSVQGAEIDKLHEALLLELYKDN